MQQLDALVGLLGKQTPFEETFGRLCRALARKMLGPSKQQVLISIDTFYASVAAEAVQAGAHIVNDVSGGSMDPAMYSQVLAAGSVAPSRQRFC